MFEESAVEPLRPGVSGKLRLFLVESHVHTLPTSTPITAAPPHAANELLAQNIGGDTEQVGGVVQIWGREGRGEVEAELILKI